MNPDSDHGLQLLWTGPPSGLAQPLKEAWVAVSAAADGCTLFQAPRMLEVLRSVSSTSEALLTFVDPFYLPDGLINTLSVITYQENWLSGTFPILSILQVLTTLTHSYKKW